MDIKTIEYSYLVYKITIGLKNSRRIAFYRVATFLLQPAAEGLNKS